MKRFSTCALTSLLLLVLLTSGGCNRLIANYEVLPLPSAPQGYTVGARWIDGIGTSGNALAPDNTETFDGVTHLSTTDKQGASLSLQIPVLKWISGSLDLKDTKEFTIDLKGLKHTRVKDAYPLNTTKDVLWETIAVDSLSVTLANNASADLNASLVASKLSSGAVGDITIHAAASGEHGYTITSDKPMVIAIRVVRLNYTVNAGEPTTLNLTSPMQGKPQLARLGYEASYEGLPDPLTRTVTLGIRNDGLPQFSGVTHQFQGGTPWVNPNREAIQQIDPQARKADYVWDILSMIWDQDLSKCLLKTVRQYIQVETADSGLRDTK